MKTIALLLILVTSAALGAAETAKELPADAAKAVSRYEADVLKLKATLVLALEKTQDAATKKGDLDAALAIKAKIASLGDGGSAADVLAEVKDNPVGKRPVGAFKDETDRKFVVIYSEPNFKGTKVKIHIPTATTEVYKINFPNDSLHSIQVPKGAIVHAYTADFGGGTDFVIKETLTEVSGEAIGMTSITVEGSAP